MNILTYILLITSIFILAITFYILRLEKPLVEIRTVSGIETLHKINDKVTREIHPNQDCRDYHLRTKDVTDEQVKEISMINGIVANTSRPVTPRFDSINYALSVRKGKAFNWDEIEPEILKILSVDGQ